jgi:hypothetical protein
MPAIFISHSSLDPQIADDIKTALDGLGFEQVFLDFDKATGIDAGENWEKRLYEELSRCHVVVLMLTPNWLASKWCFAELTQARALGKVILPIVCKPLGERVVLPEIQSVDLLDLNAGGLDKLERRLRAITNELARGFSLDPSRPPYPGIHAFEAEDAAIYFGRDDEARAVIERLDARRVQGGARCLVVIGASGSGKSSLLKAGVLPQLSRRRSEWVVLPCIRPEKAPIETIAKSIAQHLGKPDDWRVWQATLGSAVAIDHIEELLKDLRVGDARAATVLLPIDQFEEVFTVATSAERAAFLHLLASALDPARDLPLMVIATGRSDVLEGLLEAGSLAHLSETYPLMPMPLDWVPRLVEGPAEVAGLNVEKGLAQTIARDVESPEALPLLAHTLWLLYRRSSGKKLSLAEYQSLGDLEHHLNPIQNSVRLVADQAIGGLKPADVELATLRDAFVPHLVRVRLDDGKRVRQSARLSELPNEALRLIRALVEARLLSTRAADERYEAAKTGGDAVVEVTHEALFEAWPTLKQWLTEEHAFLSDIERIKSAHDIWTEAPSDQKPRALLGGLLLSRARDWLLKYPQRFLSRDMVALRSFIAAGAEAEDAEKARIAAQQARTRRIERHMLQGVIAAAVVCAATALFAGWQYFAAESERSQTIAIQSSFLAGLARQAHDRGDNKTAIALALEALPNVASMDNKQTQNSAEAILYAAIADYVAPTNKPVTVFFSPDGGRIATVMPDFSVQILDAATRKVITVLMGAVNEITSGTFSPDGSRIATASLDRTVRLWDAQSGAEVAVLVGHTSAVSGVAFSPDSRLLGSTSLDNTARVWEAQSGSMEAVLRNDAAANSGAFSPDGTHLAVALKDYSVVTWDIRTLKQQYVLKHENRVIAVAYSLDGRRVASASALGDVSIWDAATGSRIAVLQAPKH